MNYGYARVSTKTQNLDRQLKNIMEFCPDVYRIYTEKYTGTKIEGRAEFNKLLKVVNAGDKIIFDSVSRMSRNAEQGVALYFDLYDKGVELVFIKEPYINTEVYRASAEQMIASTGNDIADIYIDATNKVIKLLAEKQIVKAFEQADKEVADLRKRVSEGMQNKKELNKMLPEDKQVQIGQKKGKKFDVKRSNEIKLYIAKYSKDFDGTLKDTEVMGIINEKLYKNVVHNGECEKREELVGKSIKVSRNTYYKCKREMFEELAE